MPIFLSENSENIQQKAEQLSFRLGHFYIGCEHIFLSVLDSFDWLSGTLSVESVDSEEIRRIILETAGPGDEEPLWKGLITTPRLKQVLKLAEKEAEHTRSVRVEPNHLISAICREGKSVPARVMADQGIDLSSFRMILLDVDPSKAASPPKAKPMPHYPPPGMPYGMAAKKDQHKEAGGKDKAKEKEKEKKSKTPTLNKLGRDLVEMAKSGRVDPIVGRKDEVRRVLQTLTKKMKNNPIIIGEAGVGKTAVVYGLAQRIAEGKVPEALRNKRIIEVGMAGIIAGTKHRGEFEERMQEIIKELNQNPDIILFIDEIHTIMGAGESRSGVDAGNILKPNLARGEITIIGATTTDEYRKYIEKDPALERRFQPVIVDEPTEEETVEILKGLQKKYEEHHGVTFTSKAVLQAVKMAVRYIPDRNLPDKAIDLLDEAAAKSTMRSMSMGDDDDLEKMSFKNEVTEEDIAEVVSLWTGIPATKLSRDESERLLLMEKAMIDRVVGQDEAVHIVAQTIRMVRMGLSSPNRPSGVFLFLGPTGVGKTELAKTLAEFLFGSEKDLIRMDMSEYMEKHTISRMIGSPPGYVGHEQEGQLTKQVRTRPYSVVLLDEVEKAHPEVFDLFLQVFDDGRLTDSKGRTVNFTNTIIIMTSNIGTSNIDLSGNIKEINTTDPAVRETIMQELRQHFRPEFLNRIDEIIIFNSLSRKALENIVKINLDTLIDQLYRQREIRMAVDESAISFLLSVGYDPAYGARPMKRAIQNHLSKPLAEAMLAEGIEPGDTIMVSSNGEKLVFSREGQPIGMCDTIGGDDSTGFYREDVDYEEDQEEAPPQPGDEKTEPMPQKPQAKPAAKVPKAPVQPMKKPDIPPSSKQKPGKQHVSRIPFDPKKPELEITEHKQKDIQGIMDGGYPFPKKPILKKRDPHQDIKGILPMKGPMGFKEGPDNIDPEDFEQTKPRYKK